MKAPSAKPLFRAISGAGRRRASEQPPAKRRALDLYPTGEPDAIRGLLQADGDRIRSLGAVWEPAAGHGHMVRDLRAGGVPVIASDIADHGCPGVLVRDFYHWQDAQAPAIVTNPPYCEINARDGHGRWLRHTLSMPSWRYCALLLSWDWAAARINGLAELLAEHPFSYCYLMRWKLDFTGEGSPPQRNAWFVWDRDWKGAEPAFRFMDKPAKQPEDG